jgi:hypothetical protein
MVRLPLSIPISAVVVAVGLIAQTPPATYLSSSCVKVLPGKNQEYRSFVADYALKANTHLVSTGRAASYTILRAVMPQGEEARCDYLLTTTYVGSPAPPFGSGEQEKILQAAGLKISWADYLSKRSQLTKLVATELWRTQERTGTMSKGDYMYLNRMRVHNRPEYMKFEREVWRPLAEAMIQSGTLKAWSFHTLVLPGGTDVPITAVSADVFGKWEALFQPTGTQDAWKKAHPNRDYNEAFQSLPKLRDLARRELYVVEERVTAAPTTVSQKQ